MKKKSLIRNFIDDLSIYLPGKILPALAGLISIPLFARIFSPEEYGILSLLTAITALGNIIVCNWLTSSMVRFQPYYKKNNEIDRYYASLFVAYGLTILVFLSFWLLGIGYLEHTSLNIDIQNKLPLVGYIILSLGLFGILKTIFRINRQPKLYVSFDLFHVYGSLGLWLLFVILFKYGVEGVLWGTFIATLLANLMMVVIVMKQGVRISFNHFSTNTLKEFMKYGLIGSLSTIGTWMLSLSDRYIIEIFRGSIEVGYYSMGYAITNKSIGIVVSSIILAVSPILVSTWENKDRASTEKLLTQVTRVMLLLVMPMVVGLSALATPLFVTLATVKYLPSTSVAMWVAVGVFTYGLSLLAYTGLIMAKKMGIMLRNYIIAGILNIILNILLVPYYGFNVAAITTFLSFAFLLALNIISSNQYLSWVFPWRSFRNALFSSIIMGGALLLVRHFVPDSLISLIALIILGVAIYIVVLIIIGEIDKKEYRGITQKFGLRN